jgi:hypothetical protein
MQAETRGAKHTVRAVFVKLLRHSRTDRGMTLIEEDSRCIRQGELHEIVVTDTDPLPGGRIDRVGFLGFVEVTRAGVIEVGDQVLLRDRPIGSVVGFDACHYPNHYNILIRAGELLTATTTELGLDDEMAFLDASNGA